MFKPRFLMSARERSLRDAQFGDLQDVRMAFRKMTAAQREDAVNETRIYWRLCLRNYFASLGVLFMGILSLVANLVAAIVLHAPILLVSAVMISSMVVLHFSELEFKRDVFFGTQRTYFEMTTPELSRFDD